MGAVLSKSSPKEEEMLYCGTGTPSLGDSVRGAQLSGRPKAGKAGRTQSHTLTISNWTAFKRGGSGSRRKIPQKSFQFSIVGNLEQMPILDVEWDRKWFGHLEIQDEIDANGSTRMTFDHNWKVTSSVSCWMIRAQRLDKWYYRLRIRRTLNHFTDWPWIHSQLCHL